MKEVLSANDAFPVMIESLAADKDFKMPLNRSIFEQWCSHLLARVTKPIDAALADAKMTLVRVIPIMFELFFRAGAAAITARLIRFIQ